MFSVGTSLRLPVPIGRVWRLLVDIERYGDWHPTLRFTDRPGDEERVDYVYSPRGPRGPELSAEGRITGLDWLSGFSWRKCFSSAAFERRRNTEQARRRKG